MARMAGPVRPNKEFGTICHAKVAKTYEDDLGFYICYDELKQVPGYYVSGKKVPSSTLQGSIMTGDRILEINGKEVSGLPPDEVMNIIMRSPRECVTLKLQAGPYILGRETRMYSRMLDSQDPKNFWITGAFQRDYSGNSEDITVKLHKTNGILGFNVSSFDGLDIRYYVSSIISETASRLLCVGDEILQINGVHIKDNKTHGEVIELFIKSPDPCVMRVRRSKQVPNHTGNDQEAPPSYEECHNLSQTVPKPKII